MGDLRWWDFRLLLFLRSAARKNVSNFFASIHPVDEINVVLYITVYVICVQGMLMDGYVF